MEGRDIGTYVFPNADVKIYLDATPEERANRRYKQNQILGIDMPYEEILENIKTRDKNDMEKEIGALKKADDAVYIDSTNMNIEEVTNKVLEIINEKVLLFFIISIRTEKIIIKPPIERAVLIPSSRDFFKA